MSVLANEELARQNWTASLTIALPLTLPSYTASRQRSFIQSPVIYHRCLS